ncbi:TB2/DP1, HVA22 family-domain-containing protein [Radiomyces spectabilis]|uniref:TB2/DP1, HVA22 family-domain-containing protein n=1 Tax=Radiomyces spectabilis TaxID=64574 RepID=UPI00221FEC58|nr:TB2/DP1, HVA22 family-domain-containing protein [Radiomyces spectabilis]KAI8365202.1 TB2/DP1, HVA22 family-domain-containing protein [Radiomyces spectabilis]
MKAVDSTDQQEKKQWLTYWVIFGFVHILDEFSDAILYMVPFFFLFKTLFLLYLALPQFKGAAVLYDRMALAFPDYFGKASTRVPPRKEN